MRLDGLVLKKLGGKRINSTFRLNASLSEIFHENTKLAPLSAREYGRWIKTVINSPVMKSLMAQPYKVYSLMDRAALPSAPAQTELESIIVRRRSVREYGNTPITCEELSRLLLYSYGKTDRGKLSRPVPSGGGLYPLELYIAAVNISGLAQGIYHYNVENHCLDVVKLLEVLPALQPIIWTDEIDVQNAAMIVITSAMFNRMTIKYKDRGYRMALMEAGAVNQNLSLLCQEMSLGICAVGGFYDDLLSQALGIDGVDEAPLLVSIIGRGQTVSGGLTASETGAK